MLLTRCSALCLAFCWLMPPMTCLAQPAAIPVSAPPSETETHSPRAIRRTLLRQAQDYVLTSGKTELKLVKNSLLNWSNTARTTEQGVLMVWLDDGMPLAMASLFTYEWQGTKTKHEFVSLAEGPLKAMYGSELAWVPSKAGVKWRKFVSTKNASSLEQVPKSKARRLSQMRAIAREFKIEMKDALENKTAYLRFMPEPVYRFSSKKYNTTDGAVFSFCVGTDPEAFFVVRAKGGGDWEYTFVPSIGWELTAFHGKKRVWKTSRLEHDNNMIGNETFMGDPYVSFHLTDERTFTRHPDLKPESVQ